MNEYPIEIIGNTNDLVLERTIEAAPDILFRCWTADQLAELAATM